MAGRARRLGGGLLMLALAACAGEAPAALTSTTPRSSPPAPPFVAPSPVTSGSTPAATSSPAATCRAGVALTVDQTEGPFYSPNPPQRVSLFETGMAGTRLVLTGAVLTQDCRPLPSARLDFWQADAGGAYDNSGFRLRGYQLADAEGRYRLETIVPAEYPGRTAHIHVKVTPPSGSTLTTQLYFPDAARNASDGIFRRELVVQDLVRTTEGVEARFDFIVVGR